MSSGLLVEQIFKTKDKVPGTAYNWKSSTAYLDVINITGSGLLTGIFLGGVSGGGINVVIDGVTIYNGQLWASSTALQLLTMFRFESSLQVQVRGDGSTSERCGVGYLLD